ncbi:dolichyl-diphosphooligosaccharide--protein glycosyltransferase subunit 1-like [Cervus elaphus]|uniref:dolichyl-diphosphooligosaccharide--protein glycosyltransferase subunit 1-like n=1 Tax=Cervus elaphus TaxID=9860 RepID=UPI001CC277D9|nr:dolichyl-diphosphooligosaccharide--protein glycosyltransferase subunit 1-like [Cervus elaphus]
MEAPTARPLPRLQLLLAACAPAPGCASSDAPPLVNKDVKRTGDLSSHLAEVTAEVVLARAGGGSSPRAASFLLSLEPELEARLEHLCVQVKGEDEEENNLEVRETKIKGKSGRFSTVKLPVALDPGAKVCHRGSRLYPRASAAPTQIPQSEKQFVVFEGSHYFSPYPTKTQTTPMKLASQNVESYTKLGNPTLPDDLLDYGPFRDVPAYSQDTFKVSHWGSIAAEENVDLKSTGAMLKGPFSRYDCQR